MRNILRKEFRLSASPLSYFFLLFGFMFMVPGYPILCSAFFIALGLFQTFQSAREANDTVYSALLPIAKKDVVTGRFLFVCLIEGGGFLLMLLSVLLRMTVFRDAPVYRLNALMNANFFALGAALVIFGLFNLIFVAGFYKTAYKFAKPFIFFIIAAFVCVGIAEALHHIPGLEALNAFGTDHMLLQILCLAAGILAYAVMTLAAHRIACRSFEQIDL